MSLVAAALLFSGCAKKGAKADDSARQLVKLDSTVLNLADTDSTTYVRLGLTVALAPDPPLTPVTTNLVTSVASDTLVGLVSSRTSAMLLTPAGKTDLKKSIMGALQTRLPGFRVEDVYFDEFLIQR